MADDMRKRTSILVALAAAAAMLAGCTTAGSTPSPTAVPTGAISMPIVATPSPAASPSPSVAAAASASPAGSTPTDFGAIRDSVPPSFPLPPDLQAADLPDGAYSGTYTTPTAPGAVSSAISAGLEFMGWKDVITSGPTEAGEVTIDASGASAGCRTRVTVGTLGGLTVVKVLYGATCPTE